jgi:flagellar hook-associated protein 2
MRSVTASTPTRLSETARDTPAARLLDSEKFDTALAAPRGKSLFTVDTGDAATQGFGLKMKAFTDGLLSVDGPVSTRTTALQKSLDRNGGSRIGGRTCVRAEVRYLAITTPWTPQWRSSTPSTFRLTQQITLWNNAG